VAVFAAGCGVRARGMEPPAERGDDGGIGAEGGGETHAFAPTEVRVHPLTRIVPARDESPAELHAHIELVDGWGDTVKALGVFRVDLRRSGLREGASDADGAVWEVDLREPDDNSARFDRVTQTYLIRLRGVPEFAVEGQRSQVTVTFLGYDGGRLSATARLGND